VQPGAPWFDPGAPHVPLIVARWLKHEDVLAALADLPLRGSRQPISRRTTVWSFSTTAMQACLA
jgi:hypothetical protein